MKINFLILVFSLIENTSFSQEFSFQFYIEDASGAKDTLVFGYDDNATDSIDQSFGEINVISNPFVDGLEARISDFDLWNVEQYQIDPTTFHTKTQIHKKFCDNNYFPFVSAIILRNVTFPLEISWDQTAFTDSCQNKSFITDWHPAGWFDVVHGPEQGISYLSLNNSATFTHTTHHIIANGDTLNVLFFTFASSNGISGVEELNDQSKWVQVQRREILVLENLDELKIYDMAGQLVLQEERVHQNERIPFFDLQEGTYIIETRRGGNVLRAKWLIETALR